MMRHISALLWYVGMYEVVIHIKKIKTATWGEFWTM
jgi:hypothetical protein